MGGMEGIYNMLQAMNSRRFRFVEHSSHQKFHCAVCRGPASDGYVLEDDIGRITVGLKCFHDYFLIHPQEVAGSSDESIAGRE